MVSLLDCELIKILLENELDSTSSSSSDENLIYSFDEEKPKRRRLVRMKLYVENTVSLYSDAEYKMHFRLTRTTVFQLIEILNSHKIIPTHHDGRSKITAEKAFLLVLWYLGNLEAYRQVADRFNVTMSSVHRCLRRVISFFLKMKSQIIRWPNENRIVEIIHGFERRKGIPNVLGAIDGSHIEIPKPKENQDSYINRKNYHSVLIQAVVDHEKKFIDIFCGEPGSMHDSRLLRKSALYDRMESDYYNMRDNFLIGDSAYPNLSWLVTPFKDNGRLTRNHLIFNDRLSGTRVVVENAFGLLKCRFRRLKSLQNLDMMLCSQIIMTACILHNICIDFHDLMEADAADYNQPDAEVVNNEREDINVNYNKRQEVFTRMFAGH